MTHGKGWMKIPAEHGWHAASHLIELP